MSVFCLRLSRCFLSTASNTISSSSLTWFTSDAPRTSILTPSAQLSNPTACLGRFYSIPDPIASRIISPFLTNEHLRELSLFGDFSLLIRKPALDIMGFLESAKLTSSVPRFVLYGQPGCGISVQLAHIAHYAAEKEGLIFAFCNAEDWLERCSDFIPSNAYHQGQHRHLFEGEALDFPCRSAAWLSGFVKLNSPVLEKLNPMITRPVEWTVKDSSPAGTPWMELIDFAITRPKYSTDCIGILLRDMRALSASEKAIKCYLIIDGVNFLWCRGTRLQDKVLHKKVAVDRLAIVHHLRRALQGDWPHGAVLTSVNERASWPSDREDHTPGYLLTKRGFETMDPFIPVHVLNYTPVEVDAVMHFYAQNRWFANPAALDKDGRAEIIFLADANPRELAKVAAEW
ncbi:28S ribosomal protein S29, mitochondrial [Echinococcus granulosus]|uniref:Small ribosomal subunit protein mS29 n=1 Tax=Echinococcus granulosus TaxID=6210 RepID=A0A068WXL0_ECHGR|nr:28S ribosomal protein S29, mitochondrial [Echinococcus granulosus]CDS23235.1 Mitochondrial 28S ribosomal protein S29 [Echinococcus granulosus]